MQPLKPTQSIDSNGGSNGSSQYVKPFSLDDRALPPSQKNLIDQLIRQLSSLTQQSTDEIWQLLREHLGIARNMSLTLHHFSAAEFFLQQKIQVAQQGGSQNLLEQIMNKLSHGNNKETILNFMRNTFGHTALSLLNENELKQVLAQFPKTNQAQASNVSATNQATGSNAASNSTNNTSASQPNNNQTPGANPTNGPAPSASQMNSNLSFNEMPMLAQQTAIINQLISKLAEQIKLPQEDITKQLNVILKHDNDLPWQNQHFATARDFLQMRLIVTQESFQPLNALIHLMQPLAKHESAFLQKFSEIQFNANLNTMMTALQADILVNELFTRRGIGSGKSAWQLEGDPTPVFSNLLPEIQALLNKPSFIPGLFAFVLFIIFLLLMW